LCPFSPILILPFVKIRILLTTILTLSGACTKKIIEENFRMTMPGFAMSPLQHDECWTRLTQLASPIVASQS